MNDEKKLNILTKISSKLFDLDQISYNEYELFNQIRKELNDEENEEKEKLENEKYKIGQETKTSEEGIENKMTKEKIKINIEKILSYIKDKKDYEFISDFFINEYEPTFFNMNITSQNSNFSKNENLLNDNNPIGEKEEINEKFLDSLSKVKFDNIQSIINFDDSLKNKKETKFIVKKSKNNIKEEEIFLSDVNKAKSFSNSSLKKTKEEIDEEMEDEINRQIFGYTKRMKESAKYFGEQLRKDNRTLSDISIIQEKDSDKTKTQIKRLSDFNSTSLGFFKLLFLILIVLSTFVITLMIMKIFPKLA